MALFLYEFLYRGRHADDPEPPAYHVILADVSVDAFNRTHVNVGPARTPERAAENGFDLPAVIKAINTGVMAENHALKLAHGELQDRHDELIAQHAELAQRAAEIEKERAVLAGKLAAT